MALQEMNPWSLPDSFTVYKLAPEYVRPLLHEHWQTQKAVHPIWSYFFGLYYLVMGIINYFQNYFYLPNVYLLKTFNSLISGSMAIAGNTMVLKIFSRYDKLRTPSNMLVVNLAFSDLMLMLTLVPESVYNFFSGGTWQFGALGCQIHSFCGMKMKTISLNKLTASIIDLHYVNLGAFFGYSQITTLTIISWDRYNVIVNGFQGSPMTYTKATLWILFNWIWAFGWAISPLVGWGLYALDGMMGTCSFDHYTATMNHKSHILASCFFQFAFPIIIIIGCYAGIVKAVFHHEDELRQQAKKMNVTSLRSNSAEQQQVTAEIRAAKVAVVNITLWIFAWTPFTVIILYYIILIL